MFLLANEGTPMNPKTHYGPRRMHSLLKETNENLGFVIAFVYFLATFWIAAPVWTCVTMCLTSSLVQMYNRVDYPACIKPNRLKLYKE